MPTEFDALPPLNSNTMTYFVALVRSTGVLKRNSINWEEPVRVDTFKVSEVASTAPVGTLDVP